MSNVISFLEKMGGDARLSRALPGEISRELDCLEIAPELKSAILRKDQQLVEALLAHGPRCCLMFPVKEDGEEEEETPSQDGEEISSMFSLSPLERVA